MGGLSSLATIGLNAALQGIAEKRDNRRLREEEKRRKRELLQRFAEREQKTRADLRRRLAAERARAGAAGVASGGSFDAILRSLRSETDRSLSAGRRDLALGLENLSDLFGRRRRRNLLETTGGFLTLGRQAFGGFRRNLLG